MDQIIVTPQGCELGDDLRSLRKAAGFDSGRNFALQLGWDPSKVSNIEHGKVRASETDLAQYLTACGKDRHSIAQFFERSRNIFDQYYAQSSESFGTIAFVERSATSITSYGGTTIPDLLRTDAYTKKMMQRAGATDDQVRAAIESLRLRQSILLRTNRPRCVFYLTERAIESADGMNESTLDQIEQLKQTRFPIYLVHNEKEALAATDFTIYDYDKRPATVFIDCEMAKVFTSDEAGVARCRSVVDTLNKVSMPRADSRNRIGKLIADRQVSTLLEATAEGPSDGDAI